MMNFDLFLPLLNEEQRETSIIGAISKFLPAQTGLIDFLFASNQNSFKRRIKRSILMGDAIENLYKIEIDHLKREIEDEGFDAFVELLSEKMKDVDFNFIDNFTKSLSDGLFDGEEDSSIRELVKILKTKIKENEIIQTMISSPDNLVNLVERKIAQMFDDGIDMSSRIVIVLYLFEISNEEKNIFVNSAMLLYENYQKNIFLDKLITEYQELSQVKDEGFVRGVPKRSQNDGITSLSNEATFLLFKYLQKERVILSGEYLSDNGIAESLHSLTGYSTNTLARKPKDYKEALTLTQKKLKEILLLISNDLALK